VRPHAKRQRQEPKTGAGNLQSEENGEITMNESEIKIRFAEIEKRIGRLETATGALAPQTETEEV